MSCSGEIVAENDLLQIKPAVTKKLKKGKIWNCRPFNCRALPLDKKIIQRGRKLLQTQVLRNINASMHGIFTYWNVLPEQMCLLAGETCRNLSDAISFNAHGLEFVMPLILKIRTPAIDTSVLEYIPAGENSSIDALISVKLVFVTISFSSE